MLTRMTSNNRITALQKGLDGSALRFKVIANNIANVNTPGFKRSDVSFTSEIQKILNNETFNGKISMPRHIPIGFKDLEEFRPSSFIEDEYSYRNDDNNVDIDSEIAQLNKNSLYFQVLTKRVQSYFQGLSNVISKGGQQ
jgi:flagellar basal-body rod protein FlgB